jgi:hypothetical protein
MQIHDNVERIRQKVDDFNPYLNSKQNNQLNQAKSILMHDLEGVHRALAALEMSVIQRMELNKEQADKSLSIVTRHLKTAELENNQLK